MIILGLGSNIGDRVASLRRGIQSLRRVLDGICVSPVYTSEALLPDAAPAEWDRPFLNLAVAGTSTLRPRELLEAVKAIERDAGRIDRGHWSPRELDIDILAYHNEVVDESDLHVPHRALLMRDFALVPLADVAPGWVYPVPGPSQGMTALALAARMQVDVRQIEENVL